MRRLLPMLALLIGAVSPAGAQDPGPGGTLARFAQAWDRSDAAAIGALFAPDADLVAPDGVFPTGRPAITAYYAAAFAHGYAGSTLTGEIVRQRALAPGLAILDVRFGISGAHRPDGSLLPAQHGALVAVLRQGRSGFQILAQRERADGELSPGGRTDRRWRTAGDHGRS